MGHLLQANIDLKRWEVNFFFPPEFEAFFKDLTIIRKIGALFEANHLINEKSREFEDLMERFPRTTEFHIYLRDFLSGIAYHEFGHSNECPLDDDSFSEIIQGIVTAMDLKKKTHPVLLSNIINIFTDLIVNSIYGLRHENAFFRNALFTHHCSELVLNQGDDIPFFYFVLINERIYQFHPPMRALIEKLTAGMLLEDYTTKLKKILQIFCPFSDLLEKMLLGVSLSEEEAWKVINHISEKNNWGRMAYELAIEFLDLFPPNLPPVPIPIPNSHFTEKFEKDVEYQKKIAEIILERKIKASKNAPPKTKEKKKKGEKSKTPQSVQNNEKGEQYPGQNDLKRGINFFGEKMLLDALYRTRVKKLEIKLPADTTVDNLVLGWMNREIMTDKDNPLSLDPMMVYFLPGQDDVLLYKKTLPLTYETHASVREKGFPNLCLICDDSGSMDWEPWSGEGKYDAVIIMVYSLIQWLKERDFAPVIEYNLTCFSSTTRTSGWVDYFHLDEVLPVLFAKEGGGTVLNGDVFRALVEKPREKVIILITDGEIYNAQEIVSRIRSHRHEIKFLLIQIGPGDKFAKEVQNMGFQVVELKDLNKMTNIILDFVKASYE